MGAELDIWLGTNGVFFGLPFKPILKRVHGPSNYTKICWLLASTSWGDFHFVRMAWGSRYPQKQTHTMVDGGCPHFLPRSWRGIWMNTWCGGRMRRSCTTFTWNAPGRFWDFPIPPFCLARACTHTFWPSHKGQAVATC